MDALASLVAQYDSDEEEERKEAPRRADAASTNRKRNHNEDTDGNKDSDDANDRAERRRAKKLKKLAKRAGSTSSPSPSPSPLPPLPQPFDPAHFSPPPLTPALPSPPPACIDHSRHGGRVRGFAHVDGRWATHIHIPIRLDSSSAREQFEALTNAALEHYGGATDDAAAESTQSDTRWQRMQSLESTTSAPGTSTAATADSLHISLSRTFVLLQPQIAPFVQQLRDVVQEVVKVHHRHSTAEESACSPPHHLPLLFRSWKMYDNDTRTRQFVALRLYPDGDADGSDKIAGVDHSPLAPSLVSRCVASHALLRRLLTRVDRLLREWGAPTYYEEAELHTTIAWRLAAHAHTTNDEPPDASKTPTPTATCADASIQAATAHKQLSSTACLMAPQSLAAASHLRCTIGKRHYDMPLMHQPNA